MTVLATTVQKYQEFRSVQMLSIAVVRVWCMFPGPRVLGLTIFFILALAEIVSKSRMGRHARFIRARLILHIAGSGKNPNPLYWRRCGTICCLQATIRSPSPAVGYRRSSKEQGGRAGGCIGGNLEAIASEQSSISAISNTYAISPIRLQ